MMRVNRATNINAAVGLLMWAVALCVLPTMAFAADTGLDIDVCAPGLEDWHYTTKVVTCVATHIIASVQGFVGGMLDLMMPVATSMLVLAIVWLGIQIAGGERQLQQKTVALSIKLFVILTMFLNMPAIIEAIFAIMLELIGYVSGIMPWVQIDMIIGKIIGFGPDLVLMQGLIGILGATLISSSTGIFLFGAGFLAVLDLFLFFFNIMFIYLMAVTVVAFMLAVSPLFIPMLFFHTTERFFSKWWHIMSSALIVPMLMFALLNAFLAIYTNLLVEIFEILGFPCNGGLLSCTPPDFSPYWRYNEPVFSWLMPSDPNLSQRLQDVTAANQISTPAVQSNVNPLMRRAYDANTVYAPGVHYGPNHVAITQQLIFAFISLWIFASLMKSLITKIPQIADDIAGALNRITVSPTNFEKTVHQTMKMNPEELKKTSDSISSNLKETIANARNMVTGRRDTSV